MHRNPVAFRVLFLVFAGSLLLGGLPSRLCAQQRVFARVEPNRGIAGGTADLYDSGSGIFRPAGGLMVEGRESHTATALVGGKVLIAGGYNGSFLSSAEVYDPSTGTFNSTSGVMSVARSGHTATLLQNGKVLIAGGSDGYPLSTAEIFDPTTGTFTATPNAMTVARNGHTATLLQSGKVLIAGGYDSTNYLNTAELYDPSAGTFTATAHTMTAQRLDHTTTLLSSGKVLIAGGRNGTEVLSSAETYDPSADTFAATGGTMTVEREGHTATLLSDGRVLIAGGQNVSYLSGAELYDAAAGTFKAAARPMASARRGHSAVLLSNGKVLIAGGSDGKSALNTAETFDPSAGTFAGVGSLTAGRNRPSATLLPEGAVLIAGGQNILPVVFDINLDNSDNVPPNILFSADFRRGFVPYTGSGVVIVFSAETGGVLRRIETGGRPALSTFLKDERTLAIVSMLDDRIFLIDTDREALVATYRFSGAQFGFGSFLTVSPNGREGFISSTGTGEVIKFTVSDGREVGRLKGLQAPAQITLSNDGSILMVVDTVAEELVFADAGTLTQKTALKAKDKESTANFTIFNRAVLAPDGLTGVIASRDDNGVLSSDTAFFFKTSSGEIVDVEKIGSQPGFTTLTPDGTSWVILDESSLTVVPTLDPAAKRTLDGPLQGPFSSANVVFSPDSAYAFYSSSESNYVFQQELATSAVVARTTVGNVPSNAQAQPSNLALTPDGKTLAVLNFIGNDIDLLTRATVMAGTKFISSPNRFTGLSLLNLSQRPAHFTLYAMDNYGDPVSGGDITNPVEMTLPANNQISATVQQIFGLDVETESTGWLFVQSDEPEVAGYLTIGKFRPTWLGLQMDEMDGFPLFERRLYDWIVPEIAKADVSIVELNLLNPNYNQANYDSSRYATRGSLLETTTANIAYPTNRQYQEMAATQALPGRGQVLIAGGQNAGAVLNTAETYNADSTISTATAGTMSSSRHSQMATPLLNGKVLLTGGRDSESILATAEAYDPASGSFTATAAPMTVERFRHTATLLPDGKVLIAGGQNSTSVNSTAETYDPATDTFAGTAGPMTAPRDSHTATLLANGKVLIAGGTDGSQVVNTAELYDPTAGSFALTGNMVGTRALHRATRLPNGKVLIAGGTDGSSSLSSAEIYDPATDSFAPAGAMTAARSAHTATLLASGRVLIAGGTDGSSSLSSAEIYDPATDSFAPAGVMTAARRAHTATLLANDKVLIAGGLDGTNTLDTAEVFDPGLGTFTSAGNLTSARSAHSATLLQSETPEDGYLRMTSAKGLFFSEMIKEGRETAVLNGIDMSRFSGVFRLYAPHFSAADYYKTILNIINGNQEDAEVTITFHRPDGAVIGSPRTWVLAKGEQLKRDVASILGNDMSPSDTTGWIEIESTRDLLVGTLSLTSADRYFFTSFELLGTPLAQFVFPVAAQDSTYATGIALLNSNDTPATVTMELWGPGGTLDRSATLTLTPRTRSMLYLNGYFPGLENRLVGNIRVRSDLALHAYAILYDWDLHFVSAVPPIPLP